MSSLIIFVKIKIKHCTYKRFRLASEITRICFELCQGTDYIVKNKTTGNKHQNEPYYFRVKLHITKRLYQFVVIRNEPHETTKYILYYRKYRVQICAYFQ